MGTISDKLVYLDGTREQIKENLNKFGSNITENDTFRSYSNVLNDIYDKLPKVSGNGSNFSLENAQNGKLDSFGMDGNTEQTTYSGKNKYAITSAAGYSYSNSLPSVLSNNMVIDSYDLSNITFHTAGNQYLLVLLPTFELEPNTDYIINYTRSNNLTTGTAARRFIYEVDSSNNFSLIQQYFADEGFQAYQFTTGTTGKIAIAFGFSNNSSGSSSTVNNLMIRLATESDGTFEPYCGGTPSPNPDYPQDIHVVTGNNTINVHGKNLFDNVHGQTGNVYTTHINANEPVGSVDCYPINLLPNTQYTLTVDMNDYTKTGTWIASMCFANGNVISLLQFNSMSDITTTTFTTDSTGLVYVGHRYGFTAGTTDRMNLFLQTAKIQLEKGSATTYEPYQSQDYEIDLLDYELCKIGDYKDVIFKNNQLSSYYDSNLDEDSWYIKKEIGKVVLDGSEDGWFTQKNTSPYVFALNYDNYKRTQENICKSNLFTSVVNSGYGDLINGNINFRYNSGDTNKYMYICTTVESSLNSFKTWLSTHNTTVYYVLSTPTYEEITNSTLISQLESIEAFTGLNNFSVSNENNVLPTLYVSRLKELGKLE